VPVVPVFLFWDETIEADFAAVIREKIKTQIFEYCISYGIDFHLAIFLVDPSGDMLSQKRKFSKLDVDSYDWNLGSGITALNPSIKADLVQKFNLEYGGQNRPDEFLRPLVLVVSGRQARPGVDVNRTIETLFNHDSKPRIAVLGTGTTHVWSFSVAKDLLDRKEFVTNLTSTDSVLIDESFGEILNWLLEKSTESPASGKIDNSALQARPTITSMPPSPPPNPSRPSPAAQAHPVPESKPLKRPSINFGEEPESAPVPKREAEPTVPKNMEPIQVVENSPADTSQSQSENSANETPVPIQEESEKDSDDSKGFVRRAAEQTLDFVLRRGSSDKDIEGEVENTSSEVPPPSVPPVFPALAELVDRDLPRAADGQLITDLASTLNAKPWYSPNWKKLPNNGPSRDLELTAGSIGDLRLMAASTRGTKHQYYGDENEDSFHVAQTNSGSHVVVAVADGVSSAKYSSYGSRVLSFMISESIVNEIEQSSDESELDIRSVIDVAIRRASDRAQSWHVGELYAPSESPDENSYRQVSATLCVAVLGTKVDADGNRQVVLACVGDSPCYTLRGMKWTIRSAVTKEGALLEHSTPALPVPLGADPRHEVFEFLLSKDEVLVLMTDGIGTSLASGETSVGRWLAPRLYGPALAQDFAALLQYEFLNTITYDRQTEDDDRTLAIVYDYRGIADAIASVQDEASEVAPSEIVSN
jgi:serine/threonine protein phosphatase PrpC